MTSSTNYDGSQSPRGNVFNVWGDQYNYFYDTSVRVDGFQHTVTINPQQAGMPHPMSRGETRNSRRTHSGSRRGPQMTHEESSANTTYGHQMPSQAQSQSGIPAVDLRFFHNFWQWQFMLYMQQQRQQTAQGFPEPRVRRGRT